MNKDTYDKLIALRLPGMANNYKAQEDIKDINEYLFEQRISLMVDAGCDSQHNHRIERLVKNAHFTDSQASISQIMYISDRHLNRDLIESLASNDYIKKHENILIIGATGSGKSCISNAYGVEACNNGYRVKYVRLPDLLAEFELSRIQGTYRKLIKQYERCDLLIIDEWLFNIEQQDILEVLEKPIPNRIVSSILSGTSI